MFLKCSWSKAVPERIAMSIIRHHSWHLTATAQTTIAGLPLSTAPSQKQRNCRTSYKQTHERHCRLNITSKFQSIFTHVCPEDRFSRSCMIFLVHAYVSYCFQCFVHVSLVTSSYRPFIVSSPAVCVCLLAVVCARGIVDWLFVLYVCLHQLPWKPNTPPMKQHPTTSTSLPQSSPPTGLRR
jgi:hypothetical protein